MPAQTLHVHIQLGESPCTDNWAQLTVLLFHGLVATLPPSSYVFIVEVDEPFAIVGVHYLQILMESERCRHTQKFFIKTAARRLTERLFDNFTQFSLYFPAVLAPHIDFLLALHRKLWLHSLRRIYRAGQNSSASSLEYIILTYQFNINYITAVLHMIIFLRHAERGDNELPTKLSEIPYDPPITSKADTTIRQTSQQLSEIFRNHGITKFQLLSSKFLRCLMTASKLQFNLEKLGFKMEGTSYEVDDRVGEYLREDWYDEYPMGKLVYHSSHLAKYIGDVKFSQNYKTDKYREFPENYVKFHNRVANFKKELKFPPQNICLLIVTHGFVVRELCFTMNQLPRYQNEIKYCGYAAYKQREQGELLVKSKL